MKKFKVFIVIGILMCNSFFIAFMLAEGSKYALNLLPEQDAYIKLMCLTGVGEIKAERIAEERKDIADVRALDTERIKYSKYFTVRGWDMRTDVMYCMFGISLLVQIMGFVWICAKGISVTISKYVVLDAKGLPSPEK